MRDAPALGGQRSAVVGLVVRQALGMSTVRIVLGLAGAVAVTRFLKGMLFGISPLDHTTFVAASVVFGVVAMVAALVPAGRATKADPLIANRAE